MPPGRCSPHKPPVARPPSDPASGLTPSHARSVVSASRSSQAPSAGPPTESRARTSRTLDDAPALRARGVPLRARLPPPSPTTAPRRFGASGAGLRASLCARAARLLCRAPLYRAQSTHPRRLSHRTPHAPGRRRATAPLRALRLRRGAKAAPRTPGRSGGCPPRSAWPLRGSLQTAESHELAQPFTPLFPPRKMGDRADGNGSKDARSAPPHPADPSRQHPSADHANERPLAGFFWV